jgi:transposase InsO family protein
VIFAWIGDHAAEFTVKRMCQLLKVSRNGYYDWRDRPPGSRRLRHRMLAERVRAVYAQSRRTYGSPRIAVELKDQAVKVCRNTVATLMREEGIKARKKRRFVPKTTDSTHPHPIAPNLLDRRFDAGTSDQALARAPNQVWVCDLTYVPTRQGWLYLWAVLDLFSRKIVGWAITGHMRTQGGVDALSMALRHRKPPEQLMHHSDRGSQYACGDYRDLLAKHGLTASMSRPGNCYDNAVMESFFSTIKTELVNHENYATHQQARSSIFEWIEAFYNRQRRHSSLNYLSPEAFEAQII